ncbi:high mobility group nucleosome-binding domain-containing protein 5-like isoform X2 [Aphis gossypii]|uniref:high mobility group nucleosome-binding domain-containing protein 5-like isoform X2 n=1 Tax=Aphis gossypii TaxID=80765 RepID=UPI002158C142|nr:high mobility group nucleosome-binding domain-containing protein 5-like isoform X2 [Aphis gossypii]
MKMYSKILMVVLLAYFLDNLSASVLKPTTPTSLNGKKIPAQSKNILLPNPPKNHFPARGSFKVNPVVSLNNPAPPAPPSPPLLPTETLTPPVKLPVSLASTRVPPAPLSPTFLPNLKKENINHRESNIVEEGDDDNEEEVEEIEDDDHEEPLENSETIGTPIPSSSTSKPTVPEIVKQEKDNHQGSDIGEGDDYEEDDNEEGDDYEYYEEEEPLENSETVTSTPIPSSSTSKPTVPEIVKQEKDNHQGSDIGEEGDDYEEDDNEEGDDYEYYEEEEPLENSETVTSTPISSSLTSNPTVPEIVKQEKDNHQGSDIGEEGDDYEEEDDYEEDDNEEGDDYEYYEEEEPLENSETVTSTPISSSLTSNPTVPEIVKQEKDNHQGSDIGEEGDDYEEDDNEEGDDYEYYEEEEEPLEKSKTVTGTPIPSSSTFKLTVPNIVKQENDNRQGSNIGEEGDGYEGDDYEEEDDYEEYYDDTVVDGHNSKDNLKDPNHSTPFIPTNNIINDGVRVNPPVTITTEPQLSKDELIENNYNDSKYSTNTNEDNIENQLNDQYVSENKERIVNGYTALKKILYMLHDYVSLTFNWIINKINYRMEQFSVR